ncbi:MAG: class I SAM-dependent methyltransferase [Anaerolineae bacterium]
MDKDTISLLNAINRRFYEVTAPEFDQTRGKAWPGWERLLDHLPAARPLRVLDVGCGNGRFGVFMGDHVTMQYTGVDNNAALLAAARQSLPPDAHLIQQDAIESPITLESRFDLIGVFGVIHHVPGADARRAFVHHLAGLLNPGGVLALACWRFYEFARFQERIVPWPDDLAQKVEPHDYLLDWRRGEVALRYCHYVDDAELESLITASGLQEQTRYRADGFSNSVNVYTVLR